MKIIALASQKGGVGKTTLTAHLAVIAERKGDGPVVLIDTDPQGSLSAWWNARETEIPALAATSLASLQAKLSSLEKAGFQYVFIDTPPAITESISQVITLADFVLIPTRPSPHDLRAIGRTVELVQTSSRPFAFTITQAKGNAKLTVQAVAALSAHGIVAPAIIHDRIDYAASMVDGRTVGEVNPKSRSAQEIDELYLFLQTRMHEKTKTKKKDIV
jgi:chromosome partitioning protein